jgi:hypothetical protein
MQFTAPLHDWLQFSDRDDPNYNPTVETRITIERFWQENTGDVDSPGWQMEEWLIHSALVPTAQLSDAPTEISSISNRDFDIGWDADGKFSFGDHAQYGDISLYPLGTLRKHPISEDLKIDLNPQFVIYHALQKKNETEYYHPTDNLLVVEAKIETHKIYDPTAKITVHRDYLRDFLAAKDMGLLISVIADRFANAHNEKDLGVDEETENYQIGEYTWISTNKYPLESKQHKYFRGRSVLHRNFIIRPYDKPKFERSPWFYFGEIPIKESELPSFIINDEGARATLPKNTYLPNYINRGIGKFGYLYFRSEVLQKFLTVSGYSIFFYMRNWGTASLPGNKGSIDVGINTHGLVNAFAPDIADLDISEQAYWSSFSSLPSGEICPEMFETRMQQNPPHSPGVAELIHSARSQLNDAFQNQFSIALFNSWEPANQDLCKLSVGPIKNQYDEVLELAKILYEWVIETMQVVSLRTALGQLGGTADKKLRQIKLLEVILEKKGLSNSQALRLTSSLVGLNELRISATHIGTPKLEDGFQLMGAPTTPETPRQGWNLCVDSVINSLDLITDKL